MGKAKEPEDRITAAVAVTLPARPEAAPAPPVQADPASLPELAAAVGNSAFSGFVASGGAVSATSGGAVARSLSQAANLAGAGTQSALARSVLARQTPPAAPAPTTTPAQGTTPAPGTTPSPDGPQPGTPEGAVDQAKRKAREAIQARRKEIRDELLRAIDGLDVPVPEIKAAGQDLVKETEQKATEWLQLMIGRLEDRLRTLAADIANSDVGQKALAAGKDVLQILRDEPILREIVEEVGRILKEIYEQDSATISKKIQGKGGTLAAKLKITDITSGVTKASASLELVTKNFTAEVQLRGDKASIDMTAALGADAKLKAHMDQTGGEISLAMTTKEGKVVLVPAKLPGGKGEVSIPAEVREALIIAKVDEAKGYARATVSADLSYKRKAASTTKPGQADDVAAMSLKFSFLASKPLWGLGLEAKYRDQLIDAAVEAALQYKDGVASADMKASVSYALDSTWSLYFGGSLNAGPGGVSGGGKIGVKNKPGNIDLGIGVYKGAKDGDVMVLPTITFRF